MKKLLLISLFLPFLIFGQDYALMITTDDYESAVAYYGGTNFNVYYEDNNGNIIFLGNNFIGSGIETCDTGYHVLNNNNNLNALYTSWVSYGYPAGYMCSESGDNTIQPYQRIIVGYSDSNNFCRDIITHNINNIIGTASHYSIIIPNYKQPSTDNNVHMDEPLFRTADNYYNDSVVEIPEITWKYNLGGYAWHSFNSSVSHKFPMYANLEDIFNDYVGAPSASGPIKIKYTLTVPGRDSVDSNILIFNYIPNSPQLIENSFLTDDTSCSYTNDGGFSMKLDRNLNSDETLIVSLFFEDVNNPGSYGIIGQQATSSLIDNGDGTYTFIWNTITDGIEAGNYKVKYQTCNGCSSISNSDSSWDSLEYSNSFTVGNPPPVLIEGLSYNVTCKGDNNGKIDLQVNGGTAPYFYQIKVASESWTGNWVQFTSGNTHTINNLSSANYKVRIKDSKNCEQQ